VAPPLAVDQGQNFNHQNDLQNQPSQSYLGHFGVNTTEASQQVILFGPDASGNAGISDGENPIDDILTDMIKRKASDVHMTCGEPLCMRIDGDITRIGTAALTPEDLERLLLPMIPPRNKTEFSASNDTDFAYEIRGIGRFRVNLFRDKNGAGAVMRHIPSTILTAEQLKLPPAITKFCSLSKGLVLVTGPTGSGKSTTLAAMIDLINKERADHILTVEDPIEFVHPQHKCLINQREVHKHTGSFARALKAALREDPDIVLIGEMRDLETVAIAIETAETGHLVFGTLHTNTAVSTIDRIIDQFPTDQQAQIRMMLAASLRGVVAQTLLKKKKGGRVAAHEILVTNDAVSAMIREGKNHMIGNHMQSQKADGNLLLNDSLLKLVKEGIVDIDEAMRKSVDRSSFIEAAKRQGGAQPAQAAAPSRPPGGGNPTGR
jgi:twitching motility protein PilT